MITAHATACSCHVPSANQRLTDLFDAALQCRSMLHLDTTNHPDAIVALMAWCSLHDIRRRVYSDSDCIMHRVELPNGGSIALTEWR